MGGEGRRLNDLLLCLVCCCRRTSCATHAVIQNIFALIFACILIVINMLFIRQPNKCFFTEGVCRQLSWISYLADSIECLVDGRSNDCGNTRITLIISQLMAGVLLAMTCVIYLIIYYRLIRRKSQTNPSSMLTANEPIFSSMYQPSKKQILPMTVSHHHHHSYTISSHPYPTSAPVMIPVPPPQMPALTSENYYLNYLSPNQYATIRRNAANERF